MSAYFFGAKWEKFGPIAPVCFHPFEFHPTWSLLTGYSTNHHPRSLDDDLTSCCLAASTLDWSRIPFVLEACSLLLCWTPCGIHIMWWCMWFMSCVSSSLSVCQALGKSKKLLPGTIDSGYRIFSQSWCSFFSPFYTEWNKFAQHHRPN